MSIAALTTFGFGSYGSVSLAVVLGYGAGTTPTPTIIGGDDAWRKHHKRQNQILREREAAKLEARQELRRQIDEALNPPVEQLTRKEKKQVEAQKAQLPELTLNLELLESELRLLQTELQLHAIETKRLRDEDDIQAILLALNAPFQTRH